MKSASRFLTPPDPETLVHLTLDGAPITAHTGMTVAAAILAFSGGASRETDKGAPRTAYCMMGVCFECLVEVDGQPNSQSCMIQVRDGMEIKRQHGLRTLNSGRIK